MMYEPCIPPEVPLRIEGPVQDVMALLGQDDGLCISGDVVMVGDRGWRLCTASYGASLNHHGVTMRVELVRDTTGDL